jgi:hypothetical protein
MRTALSIGFAAFLAACAGAAPRPLSEGARQGHWQGFLLHNGLREPVSVELTEASSPWAGQLSARDTSVPLEGVRVSGNSVHFEAFGEGVFDGVVEGNSMAGSVSGPVSGSFSLTRVDQDTWSPYFLGP